MRKRLRGYFGVPAQKAFRSLSSYFVLPVCLLRECDDFDVNVTFASNMFKVRLLVKVTLLIEMTLSITTVKQVVLVMKEWYFTVIEGPSTIPKQLVLPF